MQERRQNLFVGLFVLVGLVFMGTLIVMFGAGPTWLMGRGGYLLHIQFPAAAGIRDGNQVTASGLEIGRVLAVAFIDPKQFDKGVDVTVEIVSQVRIPKQSRAQTQAPGFGAGRPPIEILPGPAEGGALPPNSTIKGEIRSAVESIIPEKVVSTLEKTATQVGQAAEELAPVLKDLHEVMQKRSPADVDRPGGVQGNLSSAMARADAVLKHFNDVLGDPETKSQLKDSLANIHQITEDGKAFASDLRAASAEARTVVSDAKTLIAKTQGAVERADGEVASVSRAARDMLDKGSQLLTSFHETINGINRGEGTLGRLVRDSKLYEALVLTAERAGKALDEFRVLVQDWQKGKVRVAF
jgi:phospholipid/cholesterol/gamma-HCH transport system substrate-binding protein